MTRRLEVFGLVFAVALTMTTMVASVASGQATTAKFTAESYPVTIHGHSPTGNTELITEAGTVKCTISYHAVLSEPTQTLTITPTYSHCEAFGFVEAFVNTEGCAIELHLTTKIQASPDPVYQAHEDIECPVGKVMRITAGSCEATIPAQTGLTTVDLVNMTAATPKKDLTFEDTTENIKYNVTKDGFLCPFSGTGAKTGGKQISKEPVTFTGQKLAPNGAEKVGIDVG